jgi:hypothetical protein
MKVETATRGTTCLDCPSMEVGIGEYGQYYICRIKNNIIPTLQKIPDFCDLEDE